MTQPIITIAKGSLPCDIGLGEAPHWDGDREELFYLDMVKHSVFRYVPKTEECYKVEIDAKLITVIVPVAGEARNKYVVAAGRTLQLIEWNGVSSTPDSATFLNIVDNDIPTNRFNDGKCDAKGRLWAGSMGRFDRTTGKVDLKKGSLYSFEAGCAKKHFNSIDIANGLTWSPDNSVMYYIDSNSGRLDAFDFDLEKGILSNCRTAFDFEATDTAGLPDGMTTDANGNVWIAMFAGDGVIQIDPRVGKQIGFVKIPANRVTSVAFGGSNLDTLYITTAGAFMANDKINEFGPTAGHLYQAVNIGAKGLSAGVNYAAGTV